MDVRNIHGHTDETVIQLWEVKCILFVVCQTHLVLLDHREGSTFGDSVNSIHSRQVTWPGGLLRKTFTESVGWYIPTSAQLFRAPLLLPV